MILVAGTLVYGRGDEEATKDELSEALASGAGAAVAAADEESAPLLAPGAPPAAPAPSQPIPAGRGSGPSTSAPVGIRGASLSSSIKATVTITHGSYSRSVPRGSVGRPGGLMARAARERSAGLDGDE